MKQSTQKGDTRWRDPSPNKEKNHQEIRLQGEQKQIKNSNPPSHKEHIK
jgi:hypothetical protein